MTTETVDQVFGQGEPETAEVSLQEAGDLLRGAVSRAVAEDTTAETTRDVAKRAYHLAKALQEATSGDGDGDKVTVDKALLEAVQADAKDQVVKGSMTEAMARLAKAMEDTPAADTPADNGPDQGGQPPADAAPSGDVSWPSDLNAAPDPNGLDDWGKDPDQSTATE